MKHSKSSLFLMELIIALLFFSLASTVCIRLFINAHTLSRETVDRNYAVNYAQNMAEVFIGCDGDLQAMQTLLVGSDLSPEGDGLSLVQTDYRVDLHRSGNPDPGSMLSADISVYKESIPPQTRDLPSDTSCALLYTLHIDLYIPRVK